MKFSFHIHTEYSRDSRASLAILERLFKKKSIDTVVITDHNEIAGALQAAVQFRGVQVIIGEEIDSAEGEIIGMFLTRRIEPGLSLEKTLSEIHSQGGLAVAVHPFDRLRHNVISEEILLKHIADIDIVEVFNSRTIFSSDNRKAFEFAKKYHKPILHGNDVHTSGEVGLSTADMHPFTDARSFLASLEQATFDSRKAPLWVHGVTKFVKWSKKIHHGK